MVAKLRVKPPRLKTLDSRVVRPPSKTTDAFYLSPEWRALLAKLIVQRGRACEECGRSSGDRGRPVLIFGDHVRELRDGGAPLDPLNVRLLCAGCHNVKTLAERAKRMRETF